VRSGIVSGSESRLASFSAHQIADQGPAPVPHTAYDAGRMACCDRGGSASIEGFQAGYVTVAGLPTWHEVRGEGPAVVLLHGAFCGAAGWMALAPALVSAGFRVHVPERGAHAHTRDVDGPLSYEAMAADTGAYLEAEVGGQAHLVGWSDGAVVALLVALRRPDLVGRLVLTGQYCNSSGRVPDSDLDRLLRGAEAKDFLREAYDPVSPDGPEHFDVVYAKTMAMIDSEPEIDLAALAAVSAPALVLQGDRDEVTLEHGPWLLRLWATAGSRVLPGTHGLPIELPGLVNMLLISFLRGAVPARHGRSRASSQLANTLGFPV
jgi:pimeloyl-ACP methyl ester carboxylesterase